MCPQWTNHVSRNAGLRFNFKSVVLSCRLYFIEIVLSPIGGIHVYVCVCVGGGAFIKVCSCFSIGCINLNCTLDTISFIWLLSSLIMSNITHCSDFWEAVDGWWRDDAPCLTVYLTCMVVVGSHIWTFEQKLCIRILNGNKVCDYVGVVQVLVVLRARYPRRVVEVVWLAVVLWNSCPRRYFTAREELLGW